MDRSCRGGASPVALPVPSSVERLLTMRRALTWVCAIMVGTVSIMIMSR